MDPAEVRMLRFGAAFHDIGKLAIPEEILNKPGRLTDQERAHIEQHTVIGEQIIAPIDFLSPVRPLVRHGHERWDGAGYPDGLAGEAIPLGARIIFACDAYDAMTTDRPYRAALNAADALAELKSQRRDAVRPGRGGRAGQDAGGGLSGRSVGCAGCLATPSRSSIRRRSRARAPGWRQGGHPRPGGGATSRSSR